MYFNAQWCIYSLDIDQFCIDYLDYLDIHDVSKYRPQESDILCCSCSQRISKRTFLIVYGCLMLYKYTWSCLGEKLNIHFAFVFSIERYYKHFTILNIDTLYWSKSAAEFGLPNLSDYENGKFNVRLCACLLMFVCVNFHAFL